MIGPPPKPPAYANPPSTDNTIKDSIVSISYKEGNG